MWSPSTISTWVKFLMSNNVGHYKMNLRKDPVCSFRWHAPERQNRTPKQIRLQFLVTSNKGRILNAAVFMVVIVTRKCRRQIVRDWQIERCGHHGGYCDLETSLQHFIVAFSSYIRRVKMRWCKWMNDEGVDVPLLSFRVSIEVKILKQYRERCNWITITQD